MMIYYLFLFIVVALYCLLKKQKKHKKQSFLGGSLQDQLETLDKNCYHGVLTDKQKSYLQVKGYEIQQLQDQQLLLVVNFYTDLDDTEQYIPKYYGCFMHNNVGYIVFKKTNQPLKDKKLINALQYDIDDVNDFQTLKKINIEWFETLYFNKIKERFIKEFQNGQKTQIQYLVKDDVPINDPAELIDKQLLIQKVSRPIYHNNSYYRQYYKQYLLQAFMLELIQDAVDQDDDIQNIVQDILSFRNSNQVKSSQFLSDKQIRKYDFDSNFANNVFQEFYKDLEINKDLKYKWYFLKNQLYLFYNLCTTFQQSLYILGQSVLIMYYLKLNSTEQNFKNQSILIQLVDKNYSNTVSQDEIDFICDALKSYNEKYLKDLEYDYKNDNLYIKMQYKFIDIKPIYLEQTLEKYVNYSIDLKELYKMYKILLEKKKQDDNDNDNYQKQGSAQNIQSIHNMQKLKTNLEELKIRYQNVKPQNAEFSKKLDQYLEALNSHECQSQKTILRCLQKVFNTTRTEKKKMYIDMSKIEHPDKYPTAYLGYADTVPFQTELFKYLAPIIKPE